MIIIFALNYKYYTYVATDCWVKHLWKFVHDNTIGIIDEVNVGVLLRKHDSMLRDFFGTMMNKLIAKGK